MNDKLKKQIESRLKDPRPLTATEVDAVVYCEVADYQASVFSRRNETSKPIQKAAWLLRAYGLSVERYQKMFCEQHGLCAICGKKMEDGFDCHVDHDHKTGKVRGLLCRSCNTGLGWFKDSPDTLLNAIDYLK